MVVARRPVKVVAHDGLPRGSGAPDGALFQLGLGGLIAPSRDQLLAAPVRWPRPGRLQAPLSRLRGVGPKIAESAATELGLERIGDLLEHLPRAFNEPPPLMPIADLAEGSEATIVAVTHTVGRFDPAGRGRRGPGKVTVTLADAEGRGSIRATWFNQPWIAERLKPGQQLSLTGSLTGGEFVVSSYEVIGADQVIGGDRADDSAAAKATGADPARQTGIDLARALWRADWPVPAEINSRWPLPVHPASDRIPARQARRLAWQALSEAESWPESLPARLRLRYRFASAADSLRAAHFPALAEGGAAAAESARQRLAFEELLLHQLVLNRRRASRLSRPGMRFGPAGPVRQAWLASLPFRPTGDQATAIAEIGADLESGVPMQRLLMGEVGSGKTVVALEAMIRAVENDGQAVLMAPTEVLAEQHAATVSALLEGTGISAGLLTGSVSGRARQEVMSGLGSGQIALAIGTHALIEEPVQFKNLALCVIDEQHRFGVRQRVALDAKGSGGITPHLLHMSATPIPRTLALLGYGDLSLSELRELPPGRQPITTELLTAENRDLELEALRRRLSAGQQAYVICPLVSESEAVQAKAALKEAERLRAGELSGFEIAVLHGRMRGAEKQEVMGGFAAGEIQVLVATTVVEVGVDVPNATTILIEGAERFGLAQLHQLRGRVGRGSGASRCLLAPNELGPRARQRLEALTRESDGFRLAELDLRMRGAGETLGTRQHGLPGFHAVRLPGDERMLAAAQREARELAGLGETEMPGWELLCRIAEARFGTVSAERIAA